MAKSEYSVVLMFEEIVKSEGWKVHCLAINTRCISFEILEESFFKLFIK